MSAPSSSSSQPGQANRSGDAPFAEELAARRLLALRAFGLDGDPRCPARARNIDGQRARSGESDRGGRRDSAPGLLDQHGPVQLPRQAADGGEPATKIGVATGLGQLLAGVQVHGQGVRADPVECLRDGGRLHGCELDHAKVPEQEDVGRDVAHLEGTRERGTLEHGALAAEAKGDSQSLCGGRQGAVQGTALAGATRHAGDEDRSREPVAEEGGAEVDIAPGQLGQGGVQEVHVLEQGGAMEGSLSRAGNLDVVRLAPGDGGAGWLRIGGGGAGHAEGDI